MSNLVPHRHHPDLFIADLMAVPLKELAEHLEFPFFSLARQPYHGLRRFDDDRGNYIELLPGLYGLPTIQDQDILIYCMSMAMAEVRRGRPVPERIQMTASDLLRFTNRSVGGDQYAAVEKAIYRLTTLTLKTNLRGKEATYTELFGIVDRASMVRRHNRQDRPGALLGCSIVLSSWIREALEARRVLTLHDDYFRLKTPLERAVYQVVRKHCGEQRMWNIGLAKLQGKVGSGRRLPDFRRQIRNIGARWRDQDFLDYGIEFDDDQDQLVARYTSDPRRIPADLQPAERRLTPQTLETLRREQPDLDPGQMERLWRNWMARQPERPRNTQAAFLGFCRRYVELRKDGDFRDRDAARPDVGDAVHPEALRWWKSLTHEEKAAAVREFQICGEGRDWAFARTERQIIETAARMWGGLDNLLVGNGKPAAVQAVRAVNATPGGPRQEQGEAGEVSGPTAFDEWYERARQWWRSSAEQFRIVLQYGEAVEEAVADGLHPDNRLELAMCWAYRDEHPEDPMPPRSPKSG